MTSTVAMPEWQPLLNSLSRHLEGMLAEVEVASPSLGAQYEAEWIPFLGIVYDHRNDLIGIVLQDVHHAIFHPRALNLRDRAGRIESLEIIDADGAKHILTMREPLMLPAPRQ